MNKNQLVNTAHQRAGLSMMRSALTMRKEPPKSGNWFRIENKKADEKTPAKTSVYIYDEIGFWGTTASDFVSEINDIDADSFDLHINSPGGEIFDGLAIYNSIRSHKAKVTVHIDGIAASAASFIAMAGDEIIIARNAQMMIHDGMGIVFGNEADMLKQAEVLGSLSDNIADIYSQRAGGTQDEWRGLMRAETWYNGKEAKASGLADVVTDVDDEEAQNRLNLWDMAGFHYSNRGEAPPPSAVRATVLKNRAKEIAVGFQNTAEDEPKVTEVTSPAPVTDPPTPDEEEKEDEGTEQAPASVEVTPATGQPVVVTPPTDRVLINGVPVSDMSAINKHIMALEGFQRETQEANRKAFIDSLSESGKIMASQIEGITQFSNELSPEQYLAWKATYDLVPAQPMFAQHGSTNEPVQVRAEVDAQAEQIETWTDIVKRHKMGGMPVDKIKNTTSYKSLIAANPNFVL
jgi:ATP-dependent protease ClpP protease subunit